MIDIREARTNQSPGSRELRRADFPTANALARFTLAFEVPVDNSVLEFRTDKVDVRLDHVTTFRDTSDLDALDAVFRLDD